MKNKEIETLQKKYNSNLLSELNKTNILSEEDINSLIDCMPKVIHGMQHSQIFRTETEARVSVLQDIKHPTYDSKYWQCVREMNVHANELFMLNFNYKIKKEDLRLSEYSARMAIDEDDILLSVSKNKAIIESEKLKYELLQMERMAKDRIREIAMWDKIIKELEPQMKCSKDDVNEHQLISYGIRFLSELEAATKTGTTFSLGEARNAQGLMLTSIREAEKQNKLKQMFEMMPDNVKRFAVGNNIIKVPQNIKEILFNNQVKKIE